MHVQIPALAENGHRRRLGFEQRAHVAVLIHRVLGETRGSERGEPGVLQLHVLGALEELLVLGIGVRPPALDIIDAQLVQLLRDDQFVVDGEGDGFALRAVPERGIECVNAHATTW